MKNSLRITVSAATLTAALASAATADITVSSKIDTEGGLLGNVIALALEEAGLPVERRLQLGGTQVVREALLSGQIDIYPEYTGNAAFFFNEADSDVWKDAEAAHARAAELGQEGLHVRAHVGLPVRGLEQPRPGVEDLQDVRTGAPLLEQEAGRELRKRGE